MLILPAIDLIDGRTVRLSQGDYDRKTDYGLDPVEVARGFEAEGAEWLHVVDLDGAKAGSPQNLAVLRAIAQATDLRIEFGGGLRDTAAIEAALNAGAARVVLGSRLAQDLEFAEEVFSRYGERVVAGIDTRNGLVAVHGWLDTGEMRGTELARRLQALGCRRVITTDIAKDGSLEGPDLQGLIDMADAVSIPVIASGGVSNLADLKALKALPAPGVEGVITGKALYEGRFTLAEALAV
ncbi:1-(5-phosphoribosyl)-5-[(5-phosphoribosylamino)methylideneamino]imidazole-4-carboxamide isomerase [Fimbriimonas ginsengisoli]|uniref:1-(5-phosphoribosyl)-5-[(5-phosphoribosylamino)methylideneamino] imidazole-4-carboxamide isomerase n=1 Tax=Fimbriimonas ginsengisoli Gsoil 348 TaxID=661478 RepID=A0A068NW20_FIMGI|nr:1-(5-phosphoribosyl)-5-[(5-phosphoribosylamino)methylideneamino]imidazole-4-carboxamide isomerase [Fimbriimonas ginsengisoli]AIE87723.1 1-(5-phosphoribosyl)-5-[(5-phosphoribosylamino)methylideneamino] imidazole-4-carboxamide isomerase [Fimbriimonas ginsengisoli Gsoil 348]